MNDRRSVCLQKKQKSELNALIETTKETERLKREE